MAGDSMNSNTIEEWSENNIFPLVNKLFLTVIIEETETTKLVSLKIMRWIMVYLSAT